MANPYLVQPVSIGGGLAGLGQSLMQAGQIKQQREQELSQQQRLEAADLELQETMAELETAMQNKDYDTINRISLRYPDRAKLATQALNDEQKRERQNVINVGFEFLQNPQDYERILRENPKFAASVGGYEEAMKDMQEDPQGIQEQVSALLAWEGGDQWKQYQDFVKSKVNGANEYTNVSFNQQGEPYGINKKTGVFEPIPGGFIKGESKPQTVVNVGGSQSKFDEEMGKINAKAYSEIASTGKQLRAEENKIDRLVQLNNKAYEGAGAGAKVMIGQMAKNFGIDVEGLPESEAFRAISNELVLDKSQQMSGALSEGDMAFLRDTVPNLGNTRDGRKEVFDYSKKLIERQREYVKQANKFRKDNGYFDQAEFEMQFQEYADKNPLFRQLSASEMSDDELARSLGL